MINNMHNDVYRPICNNNKNSSKPKPPTSGSNAVYRKNDPIDFTSKEEAELAFYRWYIKEHNLTAEANEAYKKWLIDQLTK